MSLGFRKSWNVLKGRARNLSKSVGQDKHDNSEDPEFSETLQRFREMRKKFQHLQSIAENYAKAVQAMIVAERELAIALEETPESAAGNCSDVFQNLSEKRNVSSNVEEHICTSFNENFLLPVSVLLVSEIKECNELKHKYYASLIHFKACRDEVAEMKNKGGMGLKLAESVKREQEARDGLEEIKKRFIDKFTQIEEKRDSQLEESIQKFMGDENNPPESLFVPTKMTQVEGEKKEVCVIDEEETLPQSSSGRSKHAKKLSGVLSNPFKSSREPSPEPHNNKINAVGDEGGKREHIDDDDL